jgi:anti-sigma factor RsiW
MTAADLESSVDDEIIATLSDYLDGALPADRKAEVEQKLATDADWKRVHGELRETRDALSGLQKARAPVTFTEDVTGTIHKRSAGRFFARRTLGDRVPFGALVVVAMIVLAVIGYVMYSSQTGSLKVDPKPEAHGSEAMPKP